MDSSSGSAARTGFVIFVAMVIVMAAIYFVGDGGGFLKEKTKYYTSFPSASGLRADSKVSLSGVPVGVVTDIGFPEDIEEQKVVVTLKIQAKYADRIREDSIAWIESQGLLGDKQVSILAGSPQKPKLKPGGTIRSEDLSVIEAVVGKKLVTGTSDLLENMIALLKEVNSGKGTLGQFLKNPELYSNLNQFTRSLAITSQDLSDVARDMKGIIDEIHDQEGTLGKLIFSRQYAEEFTQAVKNANRLMELIGDAVDPIRKGNGTIGKLLKDDKLHGELVESLAKVSAVAGRLDEGLRAMEENRSLLDRLIKDPSMGRGFDRVVANLERGTVLMEKILEKIEGGKGSVGLLVNDPSIAVSLQDIFLGVQESKVVESLIRRAEEEGQALRLKNERIALETGRRELQDLKEMKRGEGGREIEGKPVPAAGGDEGKPVPAPAPAPESRTEVKGEGKEAPEPPQAGPQAPGSGK